MVMKVQLPQGGHLNNGLEKPAHQIGRRQSVNAKPVIQEEKVADDDQIGHGADEGRDIKAVHGLQDTHKGEGHPGKEHRGEHSPGQGRSQSRSLGIVSVGKQRDQGLGKYHTQHREHGGQQCHHRQEVAAKTKGLFLPFLSQILAEHGNKAGRDRRGKHHVKKDPGNTAGNIKRLGLHPGRPVVHRHQMIPV